MIVAGYAFTRKDGRVECVRPDDPTKKCVLSFDGKVVRTEMDEDGTKEVVALYEKNARFLSEARVEIPDGREKIGFNEIDVRFAFRAEIVLPATVKEIAGFAVANGRETEVKVLFAGTERAWRAVKKGRLKKTELKRDWYGYYYHNVPYESTVSEQYYNWAYCKKLTVVCLDKEFFDDEDLNRRNPAERSFEERWEDD